MNKDFKIILNWLIDELVNKVEITPDERDIPLQLNMTFLSALAEDNDEKPHSSAEFLLKMKDSEQYGSIADFYLKGIDCINEEIDLRVSENEYFKNRLKSLAQWVMEGNHNIDEDEVIENIWSVFFPEGCGIFTREDQAIESLRKKRLIKITDLNENPINNPAREILFTSNVLLTVPAPGSDINVLPVAESVKNRLADVTRDDQLYWYDHPIQIGVKNENNEFLYGLHGLEKAVRFEKNMGNSTGDYKTVCLLSVSVTHKGLHETARPYLEDALSGSDDLDNLDVYVFTETDARRIVKEIIIPAAEKFLNRDASGLLDVFGVDGEYGRHYSFLKAIALFWNVMIDGRVKATFKIDLDQVFPQDELVRETYSSAFEHFKTDLWGACGIDSGGNPVELGMIAGALVNDSDISRGLFTPDVNFPAKKLNPDESVFFSQLPQALSTEAEMMTRYSEESGIDGKRECIERIHVTGGTNGILIESLKRHRPFTPTFIGRAEDQAYILSTLFNRGERLAYVHKDGLIMRHDKESFAQEAIKSAHVSKLIGDYIRILYFSAYGRVISEDLKQVKDLVDPFTGCFISYIPKTVVYLRFALKAMSLFGEGKKNEASEFVCSGAKRISEAIDFSSDEAGRLKARYQNERRAWKLFYDAMAAVEDSIQAENKLGLELKQKAVDIVNNCLLKKS